MLACCWPVAGTVDRHSLHQRLPLRHSAALTFAYMADGLLGDGRSSSGPTAGERKHLQEPDVMLKHTDAVFNPPVFYVPSLKFHLQKSRSCSRIAL